jgi:hypothetical protein
MKVLQKRNKDKEDLKNEFKELKMKMRSINYFNTNFFKKLEEENTE